MKKLFALAGLATALFAAVPMAAQADSYRHVERDGPRGGHYERDVYRDNDRHGDRDWGRHGPDRRDYHRMERRDFGYWRPHLERARYHHFGRPVFYDDYYRVPCRDERGRMVMLTLSAYTGAVLSVSFR
ncbi:hypothetical protein F2P47_06560 [Parvibaculum sedimenti]|uniref:Transmembrane signal peptide protein n=1 Tax=Parvibaculum sedimenti TaxID=2608632 RepID=A0A6N6VIK1_9HYPH|nr:hypothetical protein [Parvibaculum sedimenti]KAB7740707.1 hypothetical protein F2P47_06560 [Parvibaculum sedimenti]